MIALSPLVPPLLHALLALLVSDAQAGCPTAYTGPALVKDLGSVQTALRNLDDSAFAASGKALEAGLPCLDQTAPPQMYASAYRYVGAVHFLVDNDPAGAQRWFRSSLELDPNYQWDAQELDLNNPMRAVWESQRADAPAEGTRVEGKDLDVPAGSIALLDGRPLVEPRATTGRPHILQFAVSGSRHADQTFLLDGNRFPDEVLKETPIATAAPVDPKAAKKGKDAVPRAESPKAPAVQVATVEKPAKAEKPAAVEKTAKAEPAEKAPKAAPAEKAAKPEPAAKTAKTEPAEKAEKAEKAAPVDKAPKPTTTSVALSSDGTQHLVVQRTRPKEKTPLLLASGVGLAAAAGLYAYSWKVQEDFNVATTTADLERLQASNHAFVLASGASLLVGVGVGYWGVILDGNTVGFRVDGHF